MSGAKGPFLVAVVAVTVAAVAGGPGCFVLDRADLLLPGTVRGAPTFGGATVDATAAVTGAQPVRSKDGRFVVVGLPVGQFGLRVTDDANADGTVDRGAALRFAMPESSDGSVAGVDLGEVPLLGAVHLSGTVVDGDGAGLTDAVVVVARLGVDATAEVIQSVAGGTFDVLAVPGELAIFVTAPGGRQSAVFEDTVEADIDDLAFTVVAAPAARVSGSIVPANPAVSVVAVNGGDTEDAAIASGNVGVFFDIDAGIYDAWFVDDGVVVGFVKDQVAISGRETSWGPAIGGAAAAEGEGEGEVSRNTPPRLVDGVTLHTLPVTGGAISVATIDDEGDAVSIASATIVPSPGSDAISVAVSGSDLVFSVNVDLVAAAHLLRLVRVQVTLSDGTVTTPPLDFADVVTADAVFTGEAGADPTDPTDAANWHAGLIGGATEAVFVLGADLVVAGSCQFGALGVSAASTVTCGNGASIIGSVVVEAGAQIVSPTAAAFNVAGHIDAGGDRGFRPAFALDLVAITLNSGTDQNLRGNVGADVTVPGGTTLRANGRGDVNTLTIDGAATTGAGSDLHVTGDLVIGGAGTLGGGDGIVHIEGANVTVDGVIAFSAAGGFSFGVIGADVAAQNVTVGGGTTDPGWNRLTVAGDNRTVTMPGGGPLALTSLSLLDGASLLFTSDRNISVSGDTVIGLGSSLNLPGTSLLSFTTLDDSGSIGGTLIVPGPQTLVSRGGGNLRAVIVNAGGTLVVGDGTTTAVTPIANLDVQGGLLVDAGDSVEVFALSGLNELTLDASSSFAVGGGTFTVAFGTVTADASSKFEFASGAPLSTSGTAGLGQVIVRAGTQLTVDGTLTATTLTVEAGATVILGSGTFTPLSCVNNGTAPAAVCP